LTVVVLTAGAMSGALLPVFVLATGALTNAVRNGSPAGWPLAAVVISFFGERILDPLLEEGGQALWRQVDELLSQRLMQALVQPYGLAPVESPTVRDRLAQAQGELTDLTPGQAGYHAGRVVAMVVQGAGSLAIVAVYRWWFALVLAAAYSIT